MAPPVAQRSEQPRPSARTRPSVLLVDDRPANLLALEALLDPLDAHTVRALTGREALQRAAEQDFAVVLLDLQLPDLSGLEVTARLREQGLNRRTPVLLMTAGDVGEAELLSGYAHGAVDFLRKPLVPAVLQAKVSVFLELFNAREALRAHEREAQESRHRELLGALLAQAPAAIAILHGPRMVFEFTNPRYEQVVGRTGLVGKPLLQALPEIASQKEVLQALDGVMRTGETFSASEFAVQLDRGVDGAREEVFLNFIYQAMRGTDGQVEGIVAFAVDVTDQVRARQRVEALASELRASEARFRTVAESLPQLVWTTRPDGFHDYFNQRWYDYTGLPRGATDGEGWQNPFHPDDLVEADRRWRHSLATGEPYDVQYRCRRHDGVWRWMLGRALPIRNAQGAIEKWFGTCTDIDDQVRAVRELEAAQAEHQRSEQRFRTLAEAMPQLVWSAGPDGAHDYFNQRFLDYTGAARGQPDTATWLQSMHPDDREKALARWRHSVATGEPFEIEYRRTRPDGEWRWLLGRALPLRDEQGNVIRWLGTSTDIEDQMRTVRELRAAQDEVRRLNQGLEQRVQERTAQLQEANRELESFSYSVSHDLRAPLRHVTGFAQLVQKRVGAQLDETSRGYLKTIFESAQQGGQLVDDLLAFSRMGRAALRRSRVQLRPLVDEVVRELAPDARGRQVEWRVGALPEVQADPAMLRQVLRNLLANALKYTRPRERALIEVDAERQGAEAGAELHVQVRDNGVGFEMQYVDKLFGVFQRLHTAEQFEGTGIGLANVKRVVTRHGGRVWAESHLGAGATFHFTLPLEDAPRD